MSVSSLQLLNEKKYVYIVFAASLAAVLLMASIGPSLLASASDDDDDIINATGDFIIEEVPLSRTDTFMAPHLIINRLLRITLTEDLVGTILGHEILLSNLATSNGVGSLRETFDGVVGDSDPGTFTAIVTVLSDLSAFPIVTFEASFVIVEGSGLAGLEGICGGGIITGVADASSTDPTVASYDLNIAYGDNCEDFNPFDNGDDEDSDSDSS